MDKITHDNLLSRFKNRLVDLITEEAEHETEDNITSDISKKRRIKIFFVLSYIFLIVLLCLHAYTTRDLNQRIFTDVKFTMKTGDRILYLDGDDIIISFDNDSAVVRCNRSTGERDTIFQTEISRRMAVLNSQNNIVLLRRENNDTIGIQSYNIASRQKTYLSIKGLGFTPDYLKQNISIVQIYRNGDSLFKSLCTIDFDSINTDTQFRSILEPS